MAQKRKKPAFEKWLEKYPPPEDDRDPEEEEYHDTQRNAMRRKALRTMRPEATIDLHGCTGEEAEVRVRGFIDSSYERGLSKVLVIHGKGKHSENGRSVLKEVVMNVLRHDPRAGETGIPDRYLGGRGAIWVILRSREGHQRSR